MDSIFIFGLALILFGPKKLPEIGRQIGKIVLEFRKASNEFKMQIEDELRASEQAERQKKLAAETAAINAGVIPVAAAALPLVTETSAPSALAVLPPGTGEQISADPPYGMRTEVEAGQVVSANDEVPENAGDEDTTHSALAPASASASASAYSEHNTTFALEPVNSEWDNRELANSQPVNSESVPPPPDRHTFGNFDNLDGHFQETDQAPTHHG